MADTPLSLEMPHSKPEQKRPLWVRLVPVWVLLGCAAGLYWWVLAGRVVSTWGTLDALVYPVASDFSAAVVAVNVREGDIVHEGQAIAQLDVREAERQLRAASREVAGLRPSVDALSMEELAERLKAAQAFEQDITRRIASARHNEAAKNKQLQELVTKHVQAQLALRTLEAQGGERTVGKSRYATVREAEEKARHAMEQAHAAYEEASLMRAALDQELAHVREENLRYRQWASRHRHTIPNYTQNALMHRETLRNNGQMTDNNLYAPREGLVLKTLAAPGQILQAGEPVVLLLPSGEAVRNAYWVLAYFSQEEGTRIKAGQKCSLSVKGENGHFSGKVYDLLVPQPLPDTAHTVDGNRDAAALFIPVRVLIDNNDARVLMPGVEARCVVSTRSILP